MLKLIGLAFVGAPAVGVASAEAAAPNAMAPTIKMANLVAPAQSLAVFLEDKGGQLNALVVHPGAEAEKLRGELKIAPIMVSRGANGVTSLNFGKGASKSSKLNQATQQTFIEVH
ncbi:MAG: hypothetical protein JOZ24_13010 [Candidatus Eremiobacteraeota bacterium]|nr:hypothetical protein [Candidatus Eremiobacteraeota bacterium]